MRNEDDRLLDAIDESIDVARQARCPLQISHLKTQGPATGASWTRSSAASMRRARAAWTSCSIATPTIAYQTGLTNLFPVWSRDGGTAAFFRRLDDSSTSDRVRRETLAKIELIGGWDNVLISGVGRGGDTTAEGKRLGAFAQAKGAEPYDAAVALLRSSNGNVGMVGFAMSEDNLERILAHPLGMVCSDGGAFATDGPSRRGSPHPRGLGTFPRVLGRYVRERKALTLEQAVRKMSALPASRIRLGDRGRIAPKLAADIVVFDPATVTDKATFGGSVPVSGWRQRSDRQRRDCVSRWGKDEDCDWEGTSPYLTSGTGESGIGNRPASNSSSVQRAAAAGSRRRRFAPFLRLTPWSPS
jgi:N-acyl-D-amino-acid deacylase